MARLLGIDHGLARTGVALSDPVGVTCRPLDVLHEQDQERLIEQIRLLAEEEAVEEIVVGMPRPLRGGSNQQLRAAERFADALAAAVAVPVRAWDERFTSKMARRGREQAGRTTNAGTDGLDSVAACHLLQSYLDSRSEGR